MLFMLLTVSLLQHRQRSPIVFRTQKKKDSTYGLPVYTHPKHPKHWRFLSDFLLRSVCKLHQTHQELPPADPSNPNHLLQGISKMNFPPTVVPSYRVMFIRPLEGLLKEGEVSHCIQQT